MRCYDKRNARLSGCNKIELQPHCKPLMTKPDANACSIMLKYDLIISLIRIAFRKPSSLVNATDLNPCVKIAFLSKTLSNGF